jgi:hypothetical protein
MGAIAPMKYGGQFPDRFAFGQLSELSGVDNHSLWLWTIDPPQDQRR